MQRLKRQVAACGLWLVVGRWLLAACCWLCGRPLSIDTWLRAADCMCVCFWSGLVCSALLCSALLCSGLLWPALVWSGLVWSLCIYMRAFGQASRENDFVQTTLEKSALHGTEVPRGLALGGRRRGGGRRRLRTSFARY